jgi:heterodisulfide reductase subunit C
MGIVRMPNMEIPGIEFEPETARALAEDIMERSGQNLVACYQCRRCAAGCPVAEETGYITPDRLIRTILLGDRQQALCNELVWKCVGCFTCGTRCPNEIQTARITETLKKMAKEAHVRPLSPKVANFHESFVGSAMRWGRINEIEFMGVYSMKNTLSMIRNLNLKALFREYVGQAMLGLAMTAKRRMHFGFESAKGRGEIKRLSKKAKEKAQALKR